MTGRDELEEQALAEADQHIADADARIAGVRDRLTALERGGRDASAAREVLEILEETLELAAPSKGDEHPVPPAGGADGDAAAPAARGWQAPADADIPFAADWRG
jgi:hypothetical protein